MSRRSPAAVPEDPEHRWPALLVVLLVVLADALLPSSFGWPPQIVLPSIAVLLVVPLVFINPHHFTRETMFSRIGSIALTLVLAVWNQVEVVSTVGQLITGSAGAIPALLSALRVWLTDVAVFGLLFWELDRDGPVERRLPGVVHLAPDFQFPQEGNGPTAWRPAFWDYLYFSFSNMMAFSPTDVMPLTHRAKGFMAIQAFTGFVLLALVISRAVNILA